MARTACFPLDELFLLLTIRAASVLSLNPLDDLGRESRRRGLAGWTVESESVRPPGTGDGVSLPDFSLRARPVLGLSLIGLATDSA